MQQLADQLPFSENLAPSPLAAIMRSVEALLSQCSNDVPPLSRPAAPSVTVSGHKSLARYDARAINRFFAADKYTVFFQNNEEQLITESLSSLALRLEPHGFARVHRGALVNLACVREVRRRGSSFALVLDDGQEVPVSRRQVRVLRRRLQF